MKNSGLLKVVIGIAIIGIVAMIWFYFKSEKKDTVDTKTNVTNSTISNGGVVKPGDGRDPATTGRG